MRYALGLLQGGLIYGLGYLALPPPEPAWKRLLFAVLFIFILAIGEARAAFFTRPKL